ncbi:translation initiation factor IF-2-like [Aricia agestis]|uniref:translation initiation factor IF-2-like n=1 Tax=Aricia agestis TaxID=91739 RepID=UPI001C209EAE|nr:translation initiation factor IF-2-like [Aricia agestis]
MADRTSKSILRVGLGSSGVGESHAPSSDGGRPVYTEGPTSAMRDEGAAKAARKDEEAAKAARQRAILAALGGGGDSAKKRDSPKPAPITAPAAEILTDEDIDFSQPQPNGRRSDDDMAPPLSKGAVPKPKRGRGRPPTTGQYVGLAKAQADFNREKEEALRLQAEEEVAEAARAARETRSSLLASPAPMDEDRPEQTNHALAQCVETSLGTISMVAAKSNNLKGTFQRLLKEAVSDIRATVAEMRSRGATEEMKALEAQNARLQNEVESLRKELEELRRQVLKPAEQDMRQLLSEVSRSNVETFSNMLNARLAGLESRLLPEPRLRPPLSADRARSITPADAESVEAIPEETPGPPMPKAKGKPAQKKTRQPIAAEVPHETPATREAPKAKKGRKKKRPSMAAQEAAQGGANTSSPRTEAPWTKPGHKAAECGAAEPNCSLCEAAGRVERGHELGRCPSAKKPAPGEDKAPTKKARQKSRPRGARAPLAPARMETDA